MIHDSAGDSTALDFSETKSGTFSILQPVDAKSASDKFIEFSFQQHKEGADYSLNFDDDQGKIFNLKRTKAWATQDEREEAELQSSGAFEDVTLYDRQQIC